MPGDGMPGAAPAPGRRHSSGGCTVSCAVIRTMRILSLNCGSSSLKYSLLSMPSGEELAGGEARGVGPPIAVPASIVHRCGTGTVRRTVPLPDHASAFARVMDLLSADPRLHADAVGHRIVHGGARFTRPVRLDRRTMAELDSLGDLAPLHNPPTLALIAACAERFPALPQVAVFDTAFHATIPEFARTYALPAALRDRLAIRKYGFHGISHGFVTGEAAEFLGRPRTALNAVSCHLGSGGGSLCAVKGGKSIDTTMGYSPLPGLVMSTRCGDLDPAVTLRLLAREREDSAAVENILHGHSGVLGMSGFSSDIRDIFARAKGNEGRCSRIEVTAQLYLWRIRRYLGAYLTAAAPVAALIFTDSVGEGVPAVREAACAGLEAFGLSLDPSRNEAPGPLPADVAADDSAVRVLVIHTNEERAIAKAVYGCLCANPNAHPSDHRMEGDRP